MNKQKYLRGIYMPIFLALLSAMPTISTDLYLPALPQMATALGATEGEINLTLSLFFVCFAVGFLFWGPICDKYGRRPILLMGLAIFTVASLACSVSESVYQLITSRIVQAFGASAATVVATVVIKDIYSGQTREKMLATIMSMVIIAPIIGPIIGAILLKYITWQACFVALAICGAIAFVAGLLFCETIGERSTGSMVKLLGRLVVVLKNPNFSVLLVTFTLPPMLIMCFLGASAFIYINGFGLSEQKYSFYLAFNAFSALIAPMFYMRLSNYVPRRQIINFSFILMVICGFILVFVGDYSVEIFALIMAIATFVIMIARVPSTNLMLEQQQTDTGSATSLMNFCGFITGSIGMALIAFLGNQIYQLGYILLGLGLGGGLLWFIIRNKKFAQFPVQEG